MFEKEDFVNEGIAIGKEEGQIMVAETFLTKQINKGKSFTKESAIKFLVDNLDLIPYIAEQAYNNVISKCN